MNNQENDTEKPRTSITLIITDGGVMGNVWFNNIKATWTGPMSSSITGLNTTNKIKNVILENVNIESTKSR